MSIFTRLNNKVSVLSLLIALLLSFVLFIAAIAKIVSPEYQIKNLDLAVGIFEILVACTVLLFCKKKWLWVGVALILASWCGMALFWTIHDLPCGCFGSLDSLPRGTTFLFDLLFWALALLLSALLGISRKGLILLILVSALFLLCGYFFGEWVYDRIFNDLQRI
jgi:hypothetical protein